MGIIKIIRSREMYRLRKYRIYETLLADYIKRPVKMNPFKIWSVHRKGFTTSDWAILGLNKENYKRYLSSKQYCRYHPINGYYSKLVDDKTVIKYVFNGTECAKYVPDYYYMIDEAGIIRPMMDIEAEDRLYTAEDLYRLLLEKKKLAVKLATGSIGKGFYKAEARDGKIFLNGKETDPADFPAFVSGLRNYIISEYVQPHPDLARIWPDTANTMRILVGQKNGEWRMIRGYIRFGSRQSGEVENFNCGGVLCYLDEDGYFSGGYLLDRSGGSLKSVPVRNHPDNGEIIEGRIPCWEELQKAVKAAEKLLPQTKYLGFDFVITDYNMPEILEINSLTSLDTLQVDGSILETENGKWFFTDLQEM